MTHISRDEWLSALGDVIKPLHPDALTIVEIADLFGCGRQAAYLRLTRLLKAGKARRVYKHVEDATGRMRPQPAYLLTTSVKKTHRAKR